MRRSFATPPPVGDAVIDERGGRKKLDVIRLIKVHYAKSQTSITIVLLVMSFLLPMILGGGYALWHQGYAQLALRQWRNMQAPIRFFEYAEVEHMYETLDAVHRAAGYFASAERRYPEREEALWAVAKEESHTGNSMCKVGLDVGHSSIALAMANSKMHLVTFEVGGLAKDDGHQLPAIFLKREEKFLRNHFDPQYISIARGSTLSVAIKHYQSTRSVFSAPLACGVVLFTGDREFSAFAEDLSSARTIAARTQVGPSGITKAAVAVIHFEGSCLEKGNCTEQTRAEQAWERAVAAG